MKIQYDFLFLRLGRVYENKIFFLMSGRKHGILIPDLYRYSIKIQTGIDQNTVIKLQQNHIFFEIFFVV